jgi:Cytosine/adenosine deaminases
MILTRSVNFRQGSMGCVIVKPTVTSEITINDDDFFDAIIGASTNQSLFHENDSDVHAEIATLGKCLQNGNSTRKCTIYITMPPCKRCFGALCMAGISRIVTGRQYSKDIMDVATERGMDLVTMGHDFVNQQKDRIGIYLARHHDDDVGNVKQKRLLRKEERRKNKKGQDTIIYGIVKNNGSLWSFAKEF